MIMMDSLSVSLCCSELDAIQKMQFCVPSPQACIPSSLDDQYLLSRSSKPKLRMSRCNRDSFGCGGLPSIEIAFPQSKVTVKKIMLLTMH